MAPHDGNDELVKEHSTVIMGGTAMRYRSPKRVVMNMPKLTVKLPESLVERLNKVAERHWPGHGRRGVNRLVSDAVKRYGRYCDGGRRVRNKR